MCLDKVNYVISSHLKFQRVWHFSRQQVNTCAAMYITLLLHSLQKKLFFLLYSVLEERSEQQKLKVFPILNSDAECNNPTPLQAQDRMRYVLAIN